MKSVLLCGLKTWLVNDGGTPLSSPGGRAKFYTAGTSTPETVYSDIDLTEDDALGPVVNTDKLGYLPAIWLKTDRLYKVVVEQRIQRDPERWKVLWEVDNVGYIDPHETEEAGDEVIDVGSIAALKQVDHSAHAEVMVSGYYAPGDWGEPSMFVYDPDSNAAPDDGSVVRPNDIQPGIKGRWIQIFSGDVLDVRKFGAIPDLTENSDVTAKVVNAVSYSQRNSDRSRPITVGFVAPGKYDFSGNFNFSQYEFLDLSDNTRHPVKWFIGNDVVFNSTSETVSTFTLSKDTVCLATEKLVSGNALLQVQGGGRIKVDPAWWGIMACTLNDCYVECHSVTTNDKSFENCTVESNGFLDGNVTLVNMNFSERWFKDGYAWSNLVLTGVNYGVRDCDSADSYIDIKNSQHDYSYGDLDGLTVTGKTLGNGCSASNAYFSNVTLHDSVELNNVSGTVNVSGANLSLVALECWLTFAASATVYAIEFYGGSITCEDSLTILTRAVFKHANVNSGLTLVCDRPNFIDCIITKDLTQYPTAGVFNFTFIKCIFSAKHVLTGGSDTYVNGRWIDNFGYVADPIYISQETADEFVAGEDNHGYIYSGNSGTFRPVKVSGELGIELPDTTFYIDSTDADSLSVGRVALVRIDQLTLLSALSWFNGLLCNPTVVEHTLFSIGCKANSLSPTAGTGMKVKACVSFEWFGTTIFAATSGTDRPYRENLYEEKTFFLPRTKKVSTATFKGFFKKFIQCSQDIENENVSSIKANYEFSVMR